jgi:hypothetical protein
MGVGQLLLHRIEAVTQGIGTGALTIEIGDQAPAFLAPGRSLVVLLFS